MADPKSPLVFDDLSGGINGADPPLTLAANQCLDAVNGDWWHAGLFRKRNGSSSMDLTFSTGGPFAGILSTLIRHVPGTDDSVAELWGVDDSATPVIGRYAPAATANQPVSYLVLGGGGGGGQLSGGGGGAGGLLSGTDNIPTGALAVVIGPGGTGGGAPTNGTASSWNAHSAAGGGKGGSSSGNGTAGGSGGGGGASLGGTTGGAGSQGHAGGAGNDGVGVLSGGGGGFNAAGADALAGGAGGAGIGYVIPGGSTVISVAGGGGGSDAITGAGPLGGAGGGGNGGTNSVPATVGAPNTGSGGGGSPGVGNAGGGSGIVVLSYITGALTATGGTITFDGLTTIHTFTSSGTFTVLTVMASHFTQPTIKDVPTGNGWDVTAASVNGKLFLAYKSAVDRLHVWDPFSNQIRRTGLPAPTGGAGGGLASVADTGSGTYAATARFYRIRYTEQRSGITVRRSEPGTQTTAVTPSGSGAGILITISAGAGELETHWELEASTDGVTFYRIATTAIGTTTFTDSALVATYSTNPLSAAIGTYTLQKSYKYIAGADNRLLGFGAYTATAKQDRVEFSAVVGSSDIGDAERVDTTNPFYVDLDENDSGSPTGLAGPVNGNYYATKLFELWELVPKGDIDQPFAPNCISKTIGAVGPKAVFVGEDSGGNPALYLWSVVGPYRYGVGGYAAGGSVTSYTAGGLQPLGANVEHLTLGVTTGGAAVTSSLVVAPVLSVPAHGVYHTAKKKAYFWYCTTPSGDPNALLELNVRSDGWTRHTGISAARCSVMFANTVGAAMSFDKKPYLGITAANTVWKTDDETTVTDAGAVQYQAQIITRPIEPGGPMAEGRLGDPLLVAQAADGVTITVLVTTDFIPTVSVQGAALLTPDLPTQTRVERRCDGAALSAGGAVSYTIGDIVPHVGSNHWCLDRLTVPFEKGAAKTG